MDSYFTPAHRQQFELTVKRSRFITTVEHVTSKTETKQFIKEIKGQYTDARHHCWATITLRPNDFSGVDQSDDGEPKGTAGKPMLNVLQHSKFGNIAVVVTRYFGGIKLGTGGLVRAYSNSVSEALKQLQAHEQFVLTTLELSLPYSLLASLEYCLSQHQAVINNKQFEQQVRLSVAATKTNLPRLILAIETLGKGQISILGIENS